MLNTLLFFGWVVIAVVVVWKRVHLHFTVVYGGGSHGGKAAAGEAGKVKRFASRRNTGVQAVVAEPGITGLPRAVRAKISPTSKPEVQTASGEDCSKQDCISALVNLGCDRKSARAAVERACSQGPAEFEELLRRAIREAA